MPDPYDLSTANSHGLSDPSRHRLSSLPLSLTLEPHKQPAGTTHVLQSPADDPFATSQATDALQQQRTSLPAASRKPRGADSAARQQLGAWLHVCVVGCEEWEAALDDSSGGWVEGRKGLCVLRLPPLGAEAENEALKAQPSSESPSGKLTHQSGIPVRCKLAVV